MIRSDGELASELTSELIAVSRVPPFRLGVYFDAKAGPCRVPIHKVEQKQTMGTVSFDSAADAVRWCRAALVAGYTVSRAEGRHWLHDRSIDRRRRYEVQKAKYEALTPAQKQAMDDDDVPF